MVGLLWINGIVRRRAARLAGMVFFIGLAVTMFSSLGMFFAASKAHMTSEAVSGVPVHWQVQLSPAADPKKAERIVMQSPGVIASRQMGFADLTYLRTSMGGTVQTTGRGKALGLSDGYVSTFPGEIRFLTGAHGGILLAQQTAANLHARVGTIVTIGRPGMAAVAFPVQGIVDLPEADSLFQTIGGAPGLSPAAPPDNVILMPLATWHRLFDSTSKSHPDGVRTQVHVKLANGLPPDPGSAFAQTVRQAHNLEARLVGEGQVGNNLGAKLDAARSDAVYVQLLFLFLGLPGVVLASLLASAAGELGRDRRRREQALLRIRGASPRSILKLAITEAVTVGVAGVAGGLAGAAVAGGFAFGASHFGATPAQAAAWIAGAALLGLTLSLVTIIVPAWHDTRNLTVQVARTIVAPHRRPLWSRVYLDIVLLVGAGLVFWQSMRDAYQVVLAPEGVPTISVNYITLLAPLAFWFGSALLGWRLSTLMLTHGRPILARIMKPMSHGLSGIVAAAMSRQKTLLSRGLVVMALTASFAISVAVFNTTFVNQARVDAELTNGADVAVTTSAEGLPAGLPSRVRSVDGVSQAEPMQHRFAYVGNDLQDLYGIDPEKIGRATPMSDAFFGGGNAKQVLAKLASKPDGVLVSAETVKDFQLQPGDEIRIRLQSAKDHAYHTVLFHYIGITKEFPTAPQDSFLVANAAYVARATGSNAFETLLIKTGGSPRSVASRIREILGPASGATVRDVATQLRSALSNLTAIDLSGLTRLELAFAVILAAGSSGLILILGFAERRRILAIVSALGARSKQLASFVWGEALFITLGGILFGTLAGWALSFIIVKILTGLFDPPPERLFVPWTYLGLLLGVIATSVLIAGAAMIQAASKRQVEVVRDL